MKYITILNKRSNVYHLTHPQIDKYCVCGMWIMNGDTYSVEKPKGRKLCKNCKRSFENYVLEHI